MRLLPALAISLLLLGCAHQEPDRVSFTLSYLLIDESNVTTEGTLESDISFPRASTYFHIRANITSRDNVTHYLKVIDQKSDAYGIRLPLYSVETINGFPREWTDITGIESGSESLVELSPGLEKPLEQPIFFFNQAVSPGIPRTMDLKVSIVNASGEVLGTKTVRITVSE